VPFLQVYAPKIDCWKTQKGGERMKFADTITEIELDNYGRVVFLKGKFVKKQLTEGSVN